MKNTRRMLGGALVAGLLLFAAGCNDDNIGPGDPPVSGGDPVEWETGANPAWGSDRGGVGGDADMAASGAAPSASEGGGEGGLAPPEPAPPSTTTGTNGQIEPGTLTAGSFDDHLNPAAFDAYWKTTGQHSQDAPDLSQRALITVRNGAGVPVNQAKVTVSSAGKVLLTTTTAADGRVLLLPAVDGAGDGSYQVEVSALGKSATASGLALDQAPWELTLEVQSSLPGQLDLLFVVDATGSMSDEIEFLKVETAQIADTVAAKHPSIDIRFGLIVYRDEGDLYVTRGYGFGDLKQFQAFLAQQQAGGGGDYPEAMHSALEDATKRLPWRTGNVARVAFLMADAPPHDDKVAATFDAVAALRDKQVRVYPVAASGVADLAELAMRGAAFMTLGRYLFLSDDSGVGNSHAEPHVPCYEVEKLEQLMIRMIDTELSGELVAADPASVLRTVGQPVDGVCQPSNPTAPQQ